MSSYSPEFSPKYPVSAGRSPEGAGAQRLHRSVWKRMREGKTMTLCDLGERTVERFLQPQAKNFHLWDPTNSIADITDDLIFMNRRGFVTTRAQSAELSTEGQRKAMLRAFGDAEVVERVAEEAMNAGLEVKVCEFSGVSTRRFPPEAIGYGPSPERIVTAISIGPAVMSQYWLGMSYPHARSAMHSALSIEVIDPVWGRNSVLWETCVNSVRRSLAS